MPTGGITTYSNYISNGSSYTAPGDGYVELSFYGGYASIVGAVKVGATNSDSGESNATTLLLPVNKGSGFTVWYIGTITSFRFIQMN